MNFNKVRTNILILKLIAGGEKRSRSSYTINSTPFVGIALLFQPHLLRSSNSYNIIKFVICV